MPHRAIFIALAGLPALTAAPCFADPLTVNAVRTVSISYADLRLDTQDGKAALRKRVRAAAKEVCGFNEWPLEMSVVRHTCMKAVMRNADGQIEIAARLAGMPPAMAGTAAGSKSITLAVRR